MRRRALQTILAAFCAATAAAGDLEVARQALNDGVLRSALVAADLAATNAAMRTEARLIALEALARLEDDVEIRRRLSAWPEEKGEAFRFWRARAQVRVRDFAQAEATLAAPFADPTLALPVACLRASIKQAAGDEAGALKLIEAAKPEGKAGLAGEDARLLLGELLARAGDTKKAWPLLAPLAEGAERRETRQRAGYALGFSEMGQAGAYTAGVARVRALLRRYPGTALSLQVAPRFAERLLAAGDAAGAEDEYRRYLEANPAAAADAAILERRGRAFALLGRHAEAASAFSRAEQLSTNLALKAEVAFRQAEMLLAEGRYAEAAAGYARSAGYGGSRPELQFAEADAWERAGEKAVAAKIYGELAKTDGPWGAKAKLRLATELARQGKFADAIDAYEKLIAQTNLLSEADITETYLGLGRACYRDYRFKDAAKDFKEVAARDPKLADGMQFLLALCLYGEGKDIDAKASVAALMTTTADATLRAELMLWCAKYEFNHKEYAEAQTHFETYASLRKGEPQAAEAQLWAARCAFALTDYSKAVELATRAATSTPADSALYGEALLVQGEALMELGRYAESVQVFDRVTLRAAGETIGLRAALLRADALYAMGAGDQSRYEAAIAAYRALKAEALLSPDRQIEVAYKIGRTMEKLHRTREAMDQYYRNVVLAYSEGVSSGKFFAETTRTFFARCAFALADYYAAAGDMKATLSVLGRVVSANIPASGEAQRKIADIKAKGGH